IRAGRVEGERAGGIDDPRGDTARADDDLAGGDGGVVAKRHLAARADRDAARDAAGVNGEHAEIADGEAARRAARVNRDVRAVADRGVARARAAIDEQIAVDAGEVIDRGAVLRFEPDLGAALQRHAIDRGVAAAIEGGRAGGKDQPGDDTGALND